MGEVLGSMVPIKQEGAGRCEWQEGTGPCECDACDIELDWGGWEEEDSAAEVPVTGTSYMTFLQNILAQPEEPFPEPISNDVTTFQRRRPHPNNASRDAKLKRRRALEDFETHSEGHNVSSGAFYINC